MPRSLRRPLRPVAIAAFASPIVALQLLVGQLRAQPVPPPWAPGPAAPTASNAGTSVDETHAPPLTRAPKSFAGWTPLWQDLTAGNLDLRIALAEVERAMAATRITRGGVLPTATGTVTLTHVPSSGSPSSVTRPGDTLTAQLAVGATLINLRGFHAIGTAKVGEEIAALSVADVRRHLGLSVARAVVGIASATRLAELNRIGIDAALERLGLTRKRLAAGVGDVRDLVRAQQDVAVARALIAPADESLVQAREGLAVLMGQPGQLEVAGEVETIERELIAFCGHGDAPGERVDLLIARRNLEVAHRNVDDIALKFVPTLTAQLNVGTGGAAFAGPYTSGWSVAGILTIPFYDGGIRYGERRDRLALVDEARARATQTEISVLVDISQARRSIDVALAVQASAREARNLAFEADRLARLAYAAGVGTNFDLIDAGRRLREADTQLVLRDLELARARISLPFIEGRCVGVVAKA